MDPFPILCGASSSRLLHVKAKVVRSVEDVKDVIKELDEDDEQGDP